eukprot:Em0015g954a
MQTSLLRFVHKQQRDTTGKVCTPESRPAQKLQVKRSLVHSPDDSSGSDAKRTKCSVVPQLGRSLERLKRFARARSIHVETDVRVETARPSTDPHEIQPSTTTRRPSLAAKSNDCTIQQTDLEEEEDGRCSSQTGRALQVAASYTPLEQQVMAIKARCPDTVLLVECGYRYRFFGKDAEIAAKELNIICYPDHNFFCASIPIHRLYVHVRRLVAAGYKVGVAKQMETAALKAVSDNRSGPFARELTALYTRTTLLGPDVEGVAQGREAGEKVRKDGKVTLGFLAVQPSTGQMVYDEFLDDPGTFGELGTRLSLLQPPEILLSQDASRGLGTMLNEWKRHSTVGPVRMERLPKDWFDYNTAFQAVTEFYSCAGSQTLEVVVNLPATPICCLGTLVHYLEAFKLTRVLQLTSNLKPFLCGSFSMKLNSNTVHNLEIFKNQTDNKEKGSLFWVLKHTQTPFGLRLLRKWLSHPLTNLRKIEERQEAVEVLSTSDSPCLPLLKQTLRKLPDLEKMLCSAYHKKCSPVEFLNLTRALVRVWDGVSSFYDMALGDLKAKLVECSLREASCVVLQVVTGLGTVHQFVDALHESEAREGSFQNLFAKPEQFPQLVAEKQAIRKLQQDLVDYKRQIQRVIGSGFTDYITVSGEKYLVEFKNKDTSKVPTDWSRISSTKAVTRFRPPFVVQMVRLLAQHEDQLIVAAKQAWDEFLLDFSSHYQVYKRSVDHIATLDCLLSLSQVARMPHYVRPKMVDGTQIHITAGRHPVIDQLLPEGRQFVPNGAHLSGDGMRAMIINWTEHGRKEFVHQTAESATLGVLDAIYTRMGASDSIQCCKSTFMVELQEAADIMNQATDRSLVILDELGRGTSTHDGTAVAYASLNYFIEDVRSLVLFVTHYPPLGELESIHPGVVRNYHMAYVEAKDNEEEYDKIVLLYQLEQGQADRSYGLNVAALAGLSSDILKVAAQKAKELHAAVNSDITQHLSHQINPSRLSSFKSIMKLQPGQVGLSESLSSVLGAL